MSALLLVGVWRLVCLIVGHAPMGKLRERAHPPDTWLENAWWCWRCETWLED